MKPNDVVTIFADPLRMEFPIDKAKLLEKIGIVGEFEEWWIEYLNEPGIKYKTLIKKQSDGKN